MLPQDRIFESATKSKYYNKSMEEIRIGIVGVGKMGSTIAKILSEKFPLFLYDTAGVPEELKRFEVNIEDLTKKSDIIFIAVKPKDVLDVLSDISTAFGKKLIVSIAAGIKSDALKRFTKRWARVMPNICAEEKEGIFAILTEYEEDSILLKEIFSDYGKVFVVKSDEEIDIFTATAASGPGYISDIFESFEDAFVKAGLPRNIAKVVSAQIFLGTAKMILNGKSPYDIKSSVMTPSGTTAEGLAEIILTKPFIFRSVEKALERCKQISSYYTK